MSETVLFAAIMLAMVLTLLGIVVWQWVTIMRLRDEVMKHKLRIIDLEGWQGARLSCHRDHPAFPRRHDP